MSSTYHPAHNWISFQCDHRTRKGCQERPGREAHTGLPRGWVTRAGGHLCVEHANADLQTARIDKPHMAMLIYNTVFQDGISTPAARRAWEPVAQLALFGPAAGHTHG